MPACATCGHEAAEEFRFCPQCGAAAATPAGPREQRKTVTVLFCNVTSSTALGERLDPEPLRELLARYFEAMKTIVERHGGTVEKFVGDAVMAVFGVPVLHEDDALRAVRAAAEMLAAVEELGVRVRIGVNTGEVVAGTVERLATGDAVNVAARLEQAAAPGEALLGEETVRLARDAISVEPVEPLALKGKAEPVPAFRLVEVSAGAPGTARRLDTPLVGRERELRLLREGYGIAASERSCHLFTLLGAAGVGKTRLVQEFLAGIDARVVMGRCLSYGEGITYWPVVEVVKQLDSEAVETLLGPQASTDEIAFGVRKLLEAAAEEQPLVVVWDDLHWAEPTFLDLVEHVADWSRGSPILLLCMARPELIDARPGWGGGKLNATTLLLEQLAAGESERLLDRLAPAPLAADLRARILANADGNPLFVEEMVAMLADAQSADVVVPPTIHALLAARIDQLRAEERSALEYGAVEGQLFHRGAVRALAVGDADVAAHLLGLVRKELVRPERSVVPGDDAFRFRHILIRDAAYDALPKAKRAELHERFADWLATHAELVEQDEIVGYHLEQAHAYRSELGRPADGLAGRAAERLAAAGRAALARRDIPASISLLGRAAALLDLLEPLRLALLADLGDAYMEGRSADEAFPILQEAAQLARAAGDAHVEARVHLRRLAIGMQWAGAEEGRPFTIDETAAAAGEIAAAARARGDVRVVAAAQALTARATFFAGQCDAAEPAASEAFEAARRVGDAHVEHESVSWWAAALRYGPKPVAEAMLFFDRLEAEGVPVVGLLLLVRGELTALGGDLDAARRDVQQAIDDAEDRGHRLHAGGFALGAGLVERLAGELAAAEREYRRGWDLLGTLGETGFRSTVGGFLAETLLDLGRVDEAATTADASVAMAHPDDWEPRARHAAFRARILARRGEHAEALRLAQETQQIVGATDYLDHRAELLLGLVEVYALAGLQDEARAVADEATALYERKGAAGGLAYARRLLAATPI